MNTAQIAERLNYLLADEFTSVNQCSVFAGLCEAWGEPALAQVLRERSRRELKHTDKLIRRILALGGKPGTIEILKLKTGETLMEQFSIDHEAAEGTVMAYDDTIQMAISNGDLETADTLVSIIVEEKSWLNWLAQKLEWLSSEGIEKSY